MDDSNRVVGLLGMFQNSREEYQKYQDKNKHDHLVKVDFHEMLERRGEINLHCFNNFSARSAS